MIINEWYMMSCIALIAVAIVGGSLFFIYGFILNIDEKNKNKIRYFCFCLGAILLVLAYGTMRFLTESLLIIGS